MGTKKAIQVVMMATIWGVFIVICNVCSAVSLLFFQGRVPGSPEAQIPWDPIYQCANAIFVAALVFGLHRNSTLCAATLIVNTVARTVYIVLATGQMLLFFPAVSIVLYAGAIWEITATRRQYAVQKMDVEENASHGSFSGEIGISDAQRPCNRKSCRGHEGKLNHPSQIING